MQSGAGQLKHAFLACFIALICVAPPARAEPQLTLVSNQTWDIPNDWFGGFSGIELSSNGEALTLISDRGMLLKARLVRNAGKIDVVELASKNAILRANGSSFPQKSRDTEGLAIGADGRAYVSFETEDRVAALDLSTGRTTILPGHPDFDRFAENTGLEALAIHPDGRLFALSEGKADETGKTPLYNFSDGQWHIAHRLPLSGPFRPVGADFDAHGRLYLLERTISPLGFRSRIRRVDLNSDPVSVQTLLTTNPATFDNLEGIAVWQDLSGAPRLTLISDDNFFSFQTTQIVEFLLKE